ncbi:MAG: hypothetical protein AAFZ65_04085 [Planctomycetota bacterium]
MPAVPQDTFEKRQRQRKKQEAAADKAWRRQLRRENRQNKSDGLAGPLPPEPERGPDDEHARPEL